MKLGVAARCACRFMHACHGGQLFDERVPDSSELQLTLFQFDLEGPLENAQASLEQPP